MKKRILIVSELFHPMNLIGAVRPTKLAKYLSNAGYEVDVCTSRQCAGEDATGQGAYRMVNLSAKGMEQEANTKVSSITAIGSKLQKRGKILNEIAGIRRNLLWYRKSIAFLKSVVRAVDMGEIVLDEYICVFTTFGPVGSLLAGLEVKKRAPKIRWICDFRDPMISQVLPKTFVPYYSYLQKKSVRLADHVTTVSNGYKKRIVSAKYWDKCSVIPNGYDEEDRISLEKGEDGRFSFAYVGSLYEGKRDLGLLFKAIREAVEAGLIGMDQMVFHYAGSECCFLREQASRFGLEGMIEDHGQLEHKICMQLQASVRFLVMSTWNDKGEEGVFPGKLIEYMLMGKPVINIVGGRLPECEVTRVIRELNMGVSCEAAVPESYIHLKKWLAEQCDAYHGGKEVSFDPKTEQIEARYNWKNIVKRFGELIDG